MNNDGDWNNGDEGAPNGDGGQPNQNRNARVRLQFENNDIDLVELWIGASDNSHFYLPPDGDWARDGRSIGQNMNIKVLLINDIGQDVPLGQEAVPNEGIKQFLHGILVNRSIEKLIFSNCNLNDGDIFSILVPFFQSNENFECMKISYCRWGHECRRSLASMLGQFGSLKTFELTEADDHVVGADGSRDIIEALAGHSNLKKLRLRDALSGISKLLQNPRSTLTVLGISHTKIGYEGATDLANGLACNSTLEELDLRYTKMGDEEATNLAIGLACNSTLKKLDLSRTAMITEKGWRAIFLALKSQTCNLESLSLQWDKINDAAALSLAQVLIDSSTLRVLNLSYMGRKGRLSIASWSAIFECLQSSKCKLEVLKLAGAIENDDVTKSLARSLATNTTLRELDISENENVTTIGWNAFWAVLQNSTSNLENLNLRHNSINDESIVVLADALAGNTKLKELGLGGNDNVTVAGLEHFTAVLRNPDSALEKLDLRVNAIDNYGTMTALAEALQNNSKLRELQIWVDVGNQDVTTVGWSAFTRTLCDESSIDATYNSNHTLERFDDEDFDDEDDRLPERLQLLLRANQDNCKSKVARLKVIDAHFSGENMDIHPFIEMDSKVLPHAIHWMTHDCGNDAESAWGKGFDLTYEVVSHVVATKLFC